MSEIVDMAGVDQAQIEVSRQRRQALRQWRNLGLVLIGTLCLRGLLPVLAVGETAGSRGGDLITAAVLAYEIQCRLCDAASLRKVS